MKNLFIILISLLIFVGCANPPKHTFEPYDNRVIIDSRDYNINVSKNHRILVVTHWCAENMNKQFIYLHSVDCKCGEVTSLDSVLYYMYNNYQSGSYKERNGKLLL